MVMCECFKRMLYYNKMENLRHMKRIQYLIYNDHLQYKGMGNNPTKSQQLQSVFPDLKILPQLSINPANHYQLIYVTRPKTNQIFTIKESTKQPPFGHNNPNSNQNHHLAYNHNAYSEYMDNIIRFIQSKKIDSMFYSLFEWVPQTLDRYIVSNPQSINRNFAVYVIQVLTKIYSFLWRSCQGVGLDITVDNIRTMRNPSTGCIQIKVLPPYLTFCHIHQRSIVYHNQIRHLGEVLYTIFKNKQRQIGVDVFGFIVNRIQNDSSPTNSVNWQTLQKQTRLLSLEYKVSMQELNNYKYSFQPRSQNRQRQRSISPITHGLQNSNNMNAGSTISITNAPKQEKQSGVPNSNRQQSPIRNYQQKAYSPYSQSRNNFSNPNFQYVHETKRSPAPVKQHSPMGKTSNFNTAHRSYSNAVSHNNLHQYSSQSNTNANKYGGNNLHAPTNNQVVNKIMENVPSNRLFSTNFPQINQLNSANQGIFNNPSNVSPKSNTTTHTTTHTTAHTTAQHNTNKNASYNVKGTNLSTTSNNSAPNNTFANQTIRKNESIVHIELEQSQHSSVLGGSQTPSISQSNLAVLKSDRGQPSPMRYYNGQSSRSRSTTPNKNNHINSENNQKTNQNILNNIINFKPNTAVSSYDIDKNSLANIYACNVNNQSKHNKGVSKYQNISANVNANTHSNPNLASQSNNANQPRNTNKNNLNNANCYPSSNSQVNSPPLLNTSIPNPLFAHLNQNKLQYMDQKNNIRYLQIHKQRSSQAQIPSEKQARTKQIIKLNKSLNLYPFFQPSSTHHIQLKPMQGVPSPTYSPKTHADQHGDTGLHDASNSNNNFNGYMVSRKNMNNFRRQGQNTNKIFINGSFNKVGAISNQQQPFLQKHLLVAKEKAELLGSSIPIILDKQSSFGLTVSQDSQAGTAYDGVYQGSYHPNYANMKHGVGKLTFASGGFYQGNFSWNKMEGWGKLFYSSGRLAYQGYWKNSKFEGYGKLFNECPLHTQLFDYTDFNQIQLNAEQGYWKYYQGNMKNDMKQGHGIWVLQNGEKYDGDFKQDMVNGTGIFYGKKETIQGRWENNILLMIFKKY